MLSSRSGEFRGRNFRGGGASFLVFLLYPTILCGPNVCQQKRDKLQFPTLFM